MKDDDAKSNGNSDPSRRDAFRHNVGVALGVYWGGLFIATHVPLSAIPPQGADKLAHLVGYGGLGLLLGLWTARGRRLTIPTVLVLIGLLAAYGAVDEWLQQYVNRCMDVNDWVADLIGATLGVTLIGILQHVHPLPDETNPPS